MRGASAGSRGFVASLMGGIRAGESIHAGPRQDDGMWASCALIHPLYVSVSGESGGQAGGQLHFKEDNGSANEKEGICARGGGPRESVGAAAPPGRLHTLCSICARFAHAPLMQDFARTST